MTLKNRAVTEDTQLAPSPFAAEDEIAWRPLKSIRLIMRRWRIVALFGLAAFLLSLAGVLIYPPWFSAEAVFLPPQKTDSLAGSPTAALFMQQDQSDQYLGMLGSRTVADDVIDRMGLMGLYHAARRSEARASLASASKFNIDKNSLISVTVKAKDAETAAGIANSYLEALYKLNGEMVSSAASHRAAFFQAQVEEQKNALSQAEVDLKITEEKNGIVLPQGEAEAGIAATMQLQAAIGNAESTLASLRQSETEENSQVIRLRSQIDEMRSQLIKQQASGKSHLPGSGITPLGSLPRLSLDVVRKEREVRLQETVYGSLMQQYEKARIMASDPGPQFQIVDRAVIPDRKAGPPRTLIVLGGSFLGMLFGVVYILTIDPIKALANSVRG